jgi:hypothetical protein
MAGRRKSASIKYQACCYVTQHKWRQPVLEKAGKHVAGRRCGGARYKYSQAWQAEKRALYTGSAERRKQSQAWPEAEGVVLGLREQQFVFYQQYKGHWPII